VGGVSELAVTFSKGMARSRLIHVRIDIIYLRLTARLLCYVYSGGEKRIENAFPREGDLKKIEKRLRPTKRLFAESVWSSNLRSVVLLKTRKPRTGGIPWGFLISTALDDHLHRRRKGKRVFISRLSEKSLYVGKKRVPKEKGGEPLLRMGEVRYSSPTRGVLP